MEQLRYSDLTIMEFLFYVICNECKLLVQWQSRSSNIYRIFFIRLLHTTDELTNHTRMYIRVYICMYAHIHTCNICTCIHAYTCTFAHTSTHVRKCPNACMHTHMYICTHTGMHAHIHIHMYMCENEEEQE